MASPTQGVFTPVKQPNECVLVVGGEGSGKTFFAGTAPDPIYVIGTEGGHEQVTLAKVYPKKKILHAALQTSREVPEVWFGAWFGVAEQLLSAIDALKKAEPGTVVIDSASDLLGVAAAHLNFQLQRADKPIPPLLYGQLYPILQNWLAEIREHHNVVLTCRLKDKYENEQKTGEQGIDLWKTGPYMAETILWIERDVFSGHRFAHVTKGINEGRLLLSPTWEEVVNPGARDRTNYRRALRRLAKAYDYAEAQGLYLERTIPETADAVTARVEEIRRALTQSEPAKNGAAQEV